MLEDKELILELKEIGDSFHVNLYDEDKIFRSSNYYPEVPDIIYIQNLVSNFPRAFGFYSRIIYIENEEIVWDFEAGCEIFEKFIQELFNSQYHSNLYDYTDFDYHCWNHFKEFLEKNKGVAEISSNFTAADEDLPF